MSYLNKPKAGLLHQDSSNHRSKLPGFANQHQNSTVQAYSLAAVFGNDAHGAAINQDSKMSFKDYVERQ